MKKSTFLLLIGCFVGCVRGAAPAGEAPTNGGGTAKSGADSVSIIGVRMAIGY